MSCRGLFHRMHSLDKLLPRSDAAMARQFDNTEKMKDLYYAIGYYRRRKGLSQERLAEELGISRQHLASIEAPNMDRGLSLELLLNIATVLQIDPYMLFKFSPEK